MKLADYAQGRNNNFNLVRILSALAVLITHSFALAAGSGDAEPFRDRLGMTMGSIAVDVFFITSGFLVTASLLSRQSVIDFAWARVLRIFPALLVMLILTVFGLGACFTTLPLTSYFSDSGTYFYLMKCATLIAGIAENLPGVFESNPFRDAVNSSLWTMPREIRMYAILALIWVASRLIKNGGFKFFQLALVGGFVVAGVVVVARHLYFPAGGQFARLFFMFFTGAAFYILKERITLSRTYFWLAVAALLLSGVTNKHALFVVYELTLAYILFYIVYVPSGWIRKYNQLGDYSYGIYIYAFPVQQSVVALTPGISIFSLLCISTVATLVLAVLSWHLLERRAQRLKGNFVEYTRTFLSYGLRQANIFYMSGFRKLRVWH
jgi:peptidoglycan/LPS O-acetylase OafA/YrhL